MSLIYDDPCSLVLYWCFNININLKYNSPFFYFFFFYWKNIAVADVADVAL